MRVMPDEEAGPETEGMVYDIAIRGRLPASIAADFDEFEIRVDDDTTTLHGEIADRAALYGVINRIEQYGLLLLELHAAP